MKQAYQPEAFAHVICRTGQEAPVHKTHSTPKAAQPAVQPQSLRPKLSRNKYTELEQASRQRHTSEPMHEIN